MVDRNPWAPSNPWALSKRGKRSKTSRNGQGERKRISRGGQSRRRERPRDPLAAILGDLGAKAELTYEEVAAVTGIPAVHLERAFPTIQDLQTALCDRRPV